MKALRHGAYALTMALVMSGLHFIFESNVVAGWVYTAALSLVVLLWFSDAYLWSWSQKEKKTKVAVAENIKAEIYEDDDEYR